MLRKEIKEELLVEFAIWREIGKPTEKIGKLFIEIAEYQYSTYCSRFNIDEEYKEDMIAGAVMFCCEQLPKIKSKFLDRILSYTIIIIRSYYVGKWLKTHKEKCNLISIHTYNTENI
jgi:hypothetical protein